MIAPYVSTRTCMLPAVRQRDRVDRASVGELAERLAIDARCACVGSECAYLLVIPSVARI